MTKHAISTPKAGPPLGAYSQGWRAGDFIFVTGTMAIDAATAEVTGTSVAEQTGKVIDNIEAILEEGGASLSEVVKANVYLVDETKFPEFNAVYAERFPDPKPVRSTIGVGMRQVPGALVEIDVVAYLGD